MLQLQLHMATVSALQALSIQYGRERWQKPVLRRLRPPPPVNDTNPYNIFRPREKAHRLHTRRVRRNLDQAKNLLEALIKDVVPKCFTTCDVEWVDSEDPLFLLYTSGSTGKPKGVLYTTGGVQLIVVGLLDTVMLLMDLCLMEQQSYFMKGFFSIVFGVDGWRRTGDHLGLFIVEYLRLVVADSTPSLAVGGEFR
ncbi:hypothetical protein L2E82_11821 [Cichorium intybus]|uniref:Uncharacterized protein n=1 Tax=Cichorium intybus TaxID=13427 RepID=A0ACB9GFE6_CICIN|nr:hypothetical protein L2E82_11821 [Cichorium intybus]